MIVLKFIQKQLKTSEKEAKQNHEKATLSMPLTLTYSNKTIDITPKANMNHPLLRLYPVLANLTADFLEPKDIHNLFRTSKSSLVLYQKPLKDSKPRALLNQVIKANPKNLIPILQSIVSADECAVLKRMNGKQEYFSKKLKTMVTLSEWNNISPLEAAAHCLDNFIVNELLKYVPNNKKALEEAIAQLQSVLDSQESEKDVNDISKAADSKTSAEKRSYLAPYKHLLQAYKTFNDQVVTQEGLHGTVYNSWDWTLMDTLWNQVWEAQRKLPTYGLQEFCDKKPFSPLPAFEQSFKEEPARSCKLNDDSSLDLDGIGKNLALALYKGAGLAGMWGLAGGAGRGGGCALRAVVSVPCTYGSAAFDRLCQVRTQELENIIKSLFIRLQKVIEAEALSSADSTALPKNRHNLS